MLSKIIEFLSESLYYKLAPFYDLISWFVSKGKWAKWQSYSIDKFKGKRILDVGCGAGNLMLQINECGYLTFGMDKSKDMIAICRKKLHIYSRKLNLIQASMSNIPIKNGEIDTVVVTFPTNAILLGLFYNEVFRILSSEGRLIIVDYPHFFKKSLINYFFGFLANIGDKRDIKDIQLKLIDSGFEPLIEEIKDESSSVKLIIADK